jgi:Mrp family chromosome partitioning ATPase
VARSAVLNSAAGLSSMEIRFIGCVLNQTARSTSSSGYGYSARKGSGYGYSYGYGYGYGYGHSKYYGKTKRDQEDSESYTK